MTLYGLALYLHILAAVGIVAGSSVEHYIRTRMRRARTLDVLTEWLVAARTIGKLMPIFAVTLLICGTYMTVARWGWLQPWILVSLVLLVAISVASPFVLEPNVRAVGRAAAAGASLPEIAALLADPLPTIASGVFTGEACAIVLLMVMKPAIVPTLAIVVVAAVLGALVGRPRAASVRVADGEPITADSGAAGTR